MGEQCDDIVVLLSSPPPFIYLFAGLESKIENRVTRPFSTVGKFSSIFYNLLQYDKKFFAEVCPKFSFNLLPTENFENSSYTRYR